MAREKYPIDFKLKIVGEYEEGKCGYKKLARKYGLSRDTVRDFVLNPKLHKTKEMAKKELDKNKSEEKEKSIEYYKSEALFWKTYSKLLQEEIDKQNNKKKILLNTIRQIKKVDPKIKAVEIYSVAGISKSTYYYQMKKSEISQKDSDVIKMINELPEIARLRAGSKVKAQMIRQRFGFVVNHKKIWRICSENGLLAQNRRKKHPKNYYKRLEVAKENEVPNKLNRNFISDEPLKKICTDVSYFKTSEGWLFLSCAKDLYRKQIIAHSISRRNDENLILDMFSKMQEKYNLNSAMIHSDHGKVYFSNKVISKLNELGMERSMSRKGNCWDNASIENFFGTLKVESGYNEMLKTKLHSFDETKKLIDNYIYFYNNVRIQKGLGWQTPIQKSLNLS